MVTKAVLREELIFLLNQATELEHSLCCCYLFTAFSIKAKPEDGLSPEGQALARRWRRSMLNIAIDEMFHLAMINDLLVAVGGAPNFDRPNFPHTCSYYMPDLDLELQPFSDQTLLHFMAIEQPADGDLSMDMNPLMGEPIEGDLDNEIGPDPYSLSSQGDVYDLVLRGLKAMSATLGEDQVFIGPAPSSALRSFLESNDWEPIRDVAAAERMLTKIVEQGEGGRSTGRSHYDRFSEMRNQLHEMLEKDPSFVPAWPVLDNPFSRTPPEAMGRVNIINDELSIQVSDLFNEAYVAMLNLLARFFVAIEESEDDANALCNSAIDVMSGVVTPLGELLARLPAGPAHPGLTAGASFVVRTLHALPYGPAARILLRQRFEELRDYTASLKSDAHASVFQEVAGKLDAIAKQLGAA